MRHYDRWLTFGKEGIMKDKFYTKVHKNIIRHDKLYGTTTMGVRGQVVIPAEARKELKLKPGDQLLVMGRFGKALGLMKTEDLGDILNQVMEHFAGAGAEREVRDYATRIFGKFFKK